MIRTVYLAGPITKDPSGYVQKFRTAAAVLRSDGFEVISPVEIDDPEHAAQAIDEPYGERYEELLARDLAIIAREDVEAVVVLPGWEESKGTQREVDKALDLNKPVLGYPHLQELDLDLRVSWSASNVRTFDTGATRDTDAGKPDYEAYLSPRVVRAYGRYMLKHSVQADGSVRAGDNWQKGMPLDAYVKSGFRHFVDWWEIHREMLAADVGDSIEREPLEEALCALIFNASGYLHELLGDPGRTQPTHCACTDEREPRRAECR